MPHDTKDVIISVLGNLPAIFFTELNPFLLLVIVSSKTNCLSLSATKGKPFSQNCMTISANPRPNFLNNLEVNKRVQTKQMIKSHLQHFTWNKFSYGFLIYLLWIKAFNFLLPLVIWPLAFLFSAVSKDDLWYPCFSVILTKVYFYFLVVNLEFPSVCLIVHMPNQVSVGFSWKNDPGKVHHGPSSSPFSIM